MGQSRPILPKKFLASIWIHMSHEMQYIFNRPCSGLKISKIDKNIPKYAKIGLFQ